LSCLFCRIVQGEIPARIVHQDEHVLAFHDVAPQAPVHVLVIPRVHLDSLAATQPEHDVLLGHILATVRQVARDLGVADAGYRTVLNTGNDGGQSVGHLHAHLLAGRHLGWPPG
jgi:histidine triad (HIT) family protein